MQDIQSPGVATLAEQLVERFGLLMSQSQLAELLGRSTGDPRYSLSCPRDHQPRSPGSGFPGRYCHTRNHQRNPKRITTTTRHRAESSVRSWWIGAAVFPQGSPARGTRTRGGSGCGTGRST